MTNIVQEFKDLLEGGKYSDEDAHVMFELFKKHKADEKDALATTTVVPPIIPSKVEPIATPVPSTVEVPETVTSDTKEFTMEELGKLITDKIAEHDLAKAKPQTNFSPVIENPRLNKPRYKVLKMNNNR